MAELSAETQNPSSETEVPPRKNKSSAQSQKKLKDGNERRMEKSDKTKLTLNTINHKESKLNNYGLKNKEEIDDEKKTPKSQDQQLLSSVPSKKSKKLNKGSKKVSNETDSTEKKTRRSRKKIKEGNQSEVEGDVEIDDGHVMQVIVHRSDRLKFNMLMSHPLVSVSLVEANTGSYVKKSDKDRPVISRYETTNKNLDYIQPVLTLPFDFKHNQSITPVWEDSIIINEAFNHFVRPGANVILFFQLMDFVGAHYVNSNPQLQQGWFTIAWAFLQLVGANESPNWGQKVRLQLYKVPHVLHSSAKKSSDVEVFQWWSSNSRVSYPSTLYVTVNKVKVINEVTPSLRSLFPLQEEAGLNHFSDQSRTSLAISSSDQTNDDLDYLTSWTRLPGQSCQIPRTPHKILASALKGCSYVKFSKDGRFLACGCQDIDGFPLVIYEVPSFQCMMTLKGHLGIIYDICWTKDSKHVISTSADGSIRVWSLDARLTRTSAFHPSFLYAGQIEPTENEILITAGYDRLIRVWSIKLSGIPDDRTSESNSSKLLQELNVHTSHVNAVCFHPSGTAFYSGDATGSVMVWTLSSNKTAPASFQKEIKIDETKGIPITSLDVHPLGHRLLVQTRNNKLQILDLRVDTSVHKLFGLVNINSKLRSCFSPDGSLVFSGSEDGKAYVWSTETGNQLAIYNDLNFNATICCLDSHPLDDYVAFCCHGYNQPIKIYKYDPSEPANLNLPLEGWKESEDFNAMVSSETKTNLLSMAKSSADDFDLAHSMRLQAIRSKLVEVTSKHSIPATSLSNFYGSNLTNQLYHMSPSGISSFDAVNPRPSVQPILSIAAQNDQEIKVVFKSSTSAPMKETVIATENYSAQRSDELTFSKGDTIVVLHKDNNFWWMGHMPATMKQGYFPANHVVPKSKSSINADQSKMEMQTNPSDENKNEENKYRGLLRQKHMHPNSRRNSTTDSFIKNRVSFNLGEDTNTRPTSIGSVDLTNQESSFIVSDSIVKRGSKNLNPIPEEKQQNKDVLDFQSNGISTSVSNSKSNTKTNVSEVTKDNLQSKPPLPSIMNRIRRTSLSHQRMLPSTSD